MTTLVRLFLCLLPLLGSCGSPPTQCTAACDAQEAAACSAAFSAGGCRLGCEQTYTRLDASCVASLDAYYGCLVMGGYECAASGLPGPSPAAAVMCRDLELAARPCQAQ